MTARTDGTNEATDAIRDLFRTRTRFVLTTHVNPDGDAIGSELALASWLASRGKDVRIINHSPLPAVYRFLDPGGTITVFDTLRDIPALNEADVIVVLDTSAPERLRSMMAPVLSSRALRVCIDHHLDPVPFAAVALIDPGATSTGEILSRLLFREGDPPPGPDVARALYCAIMTDTGSFRYPRTGALTHRIAARLIDAGADPVGIYTEVFEQWSPGRIRLLGEALAELRTEYGGLLAHMTVSRAMLRRTSTSEEDTDNFTTFPMSVGGVRMGILFLETEEGLKVSVRSRGDVAANALAMEFGGNGHRNAAGARIAGADTNAARARVITAAEKYIAGGS